MTESCTPRLCWLVHSLVRCFSVMDLDRFRDGSLGCASHTLHAESTRDKMTRAAQRALAAAADSSFFMVWYVDFWRGGLSPPLIQKLLGSLYYPAKPWRGEGRFSGVWDLNLVSLVGAKVSVHLL